ncbi:hypothetical protein Tco_0921786 [Tanacetum coccineum]
MMVSVEGSDDGEGDDVILDGEDEGVGEGSGGDSTIVVNINNNIHEIVPIVQQLVLYPENLSTATCSSHTALVVEVATTLQYSHSRDGMSWRNLKPAHALSATHRYMAWMLYGYIKDPIIRSIKIVHQTSTGLSIFNQRLFNSVGVEVDFTSV